EIDFGGAHELRVDEDVLLPIEPSSRERDLAELANGVRLAGCDDVIVSLLLLEHPPHRLDVIAGESPVALGVEVPHWQPLLHPELDPGDGVGDLARDELEAAPRRLVVEENPAHR